MINSKQLQTTFFSTDAGGKIKKCIQCGTCSSSCPMTDNMDLGPRSLFALIRDGEMDDVMQSNSPWMCVSCYQCTNRCPQEILVTELMYTLKKMISQSKDDIRMNKSRDLYRSFSSSLRLFGRVTDSFVMARYSMKHPFAGISSLPLAVRLIKKRRLELKMQQVKRPLNFRRSFKHLRK